MLLKKPYTVKYFAKKQLDGKFKILKIKVFSNYATKSCIAKGLSKGEADNRIFLLTHKPPKN